jgi:elongation factor P--beta-lysine ligase
VARSTRSPGSSAPTKKGDWHNPEFTLLEWYRLGFTPDQLIDEVAAIACIALGETTTVRHRYRDLFRAHLDLDPLCCPIDALSTAARRHLDLAFADADRDTWLELLMSHVIEPRTRQRRPELRGRLPAIASGTRAPARGCGRPTGGCAF